MDIKNEEEFKVELVENTKEDDKKINIHLEQLSTLEDNQERNCFGSIDMKKVEIEIKEEPFDIEEEEAANDELLDKISTLDQNQDLTVYNSFRKSWLLLLLHVFVFEK
ncbi:hypothetical protein Avbf_14572 [Armadillidium vulgare]|nr:hypothetical protein Avbf_14572 [Armadillidium vulgare]